MATSPQPGFGGVPVGPSAQATAQPGFGGVPIAAPQPQAQPGFFSRAASLIGDTLSKTAGKLNIENTLDSIEDIGDRMRNGDWSSIRDALNFLPQMHVGDSRGPAPQQTAELQDTYQKIKGGDYSGAAANVLPYILANAGAVPTEGIANAAGATGTAIRGAARAVATNPPRFSDIAPFGIAGEVIPGVGWKTGAGIGAAQKIIRSGVAGAQDALAERATNLAAAAQRANPRPSLPQQAGLQSSDPGPIPPVQPIPPQYPTNRAATPATAPRTRVSLPQQAGVQGTTPEVPQGPNLTDAELAQIRADWQQKMQQRKAASTASPAPANDGFTSDLATGRVSLPAQSPPAGFAARTANGQVPQPEDVNLLDDIARAQAGKPFQKLSPQQQTVVQSLAQRMFRPANGSGQTAANGQPATSAENAIPEAHRSTTETGLQIPQIPQVAMARSQVAQKLADNFYRAGITSDHLEQLEQVSPAARTSFWNTAGKIEGVSKQPNYSPSEQTVEAVKDALLARENAARTTKQPSPQPAAPVQPQTPPVHPALAGLPQPSDAVANATAKANATINGIEAHGANVLAQQPPQ